MVPVSVRSVRLSARVGSAAKRISLAFTTRKHRFVWRPSRGARGSVAPGRALVQRGGHRGHGRKGDPGARAQHPRQGSRDTRGLADVVVVDTVIAEQLEGA